MFYLWKPTLHWPFSKSMQSFLVRVAHLFNLFTDSSSHSFTRTNDKNWGCVLRSEPQTLRQALFFIDVILQIPFDKWEAKQKAESMICIHRIVSASFPI